MKSINANRVHFLLSLSSLLFLIVSALTEETDSKLTGHTNSNDVEAIQLLIENYPSLWYLSTDDQDDPCLPEPYPWVTCSSDETPRITALNLGNSRKLSFGADLPDFSSMDALEVIDLSNNGLGQEFPDFLADFPKLRVLNLANNYLTGTVPTSLRKKLEEKTLKLTLTGEGMNQLCYSDEDVCPTETWTKASPGKYWGTYRRILAKRGKSKSGKKQKTGKVKSGKKKKTVIVFGSLIPIILILIFLAIAIYLYRTHRKRKAAAAAGLKNATSDPAIPIYGNTMTPKSTAT